MNEPPHKKRKTSGTESVDIHNEDRPTLLLPALNILPKDGSSNSMIAHLHNTESFNLNNYDQNHNQLNVLIPNKPENGMKARKRKRRRGIGPICNACNIEINPCYAMIKCAECIVDINEDGNMRDILLCLDCFKNGKEFGAHKRFHKYHVLQPLTDFKLQNDMKEEKINLNTNKRQKMNHNRWSANDEWNLVYGLRRYGLGNWSGITKIINKQSFKSKN